ncbi:hypothetical protein Amet_0080 [Alkaliphilus metalliredigens QYMF]|uniref:Uncharacterized protein n=1 Tax=Alkaliphilus metalliredigens (strain QYMF) TaxID=293826 RepID=A6TJF5_ALKMQ|nr:hypothetical protein [Alkaliphilus metalliredigens]ABR46323.1 hypothetical protein Amet_0080 [Alkaliphilus metalliredigens QYMF]
MNGDRITNLKEFVTAYGGRKSDIEIAEMLEAPIDQVKSERRKLSFDTFKTKISIHHKK